MAKEKVSGILTADWHLREDTPVSRSDDFWTAQWRKVQEVKELQERYKCPVFHAGDLFHHWKPSPYLIAESILSLPDQFYSVYGQHDLPNHNLKLKAKSGLYAVAAGGGVHELDSGHWGTEPAHIGHSTKVSDSEWKHQSREIGVLHKFVWDGKKIPWPDCDEMTADQVLKKYPQFDLIVTGDHHKPFVHYRVEKQRTRVLVNCGCLTRQDASYADHKPCVWLYYAESGKVEKYVLKHEKNVISDAHLKIGKERNKRIEAFISRINDDWEIAISFEENLKRYLSSNKTNKKQIKTVYKAIGS